MNVIQLNNYIPLICEQNCLYKGIAFDGNNFYLSCPDTCKIYKVDRCFKQKEIIKTCRPYFSLCYDYSYRCFWALSYKESDKIYKLDECLKEIGCIRINICNCNCIKLTGITSCDCDTLVVCGNFGIASISKNNDKLSEIYKDFKKKKEYNAVSCSCCGLVYALNKNKSNMLSWKESYNNYVKFYLPECYDIEDITWCKGEKCCWIYALVTKMCCCSYILVFKLCDIKEQKCRCMIQPCENNCCEEYICQENDCSKSAAGIIESISLVEAALSHILNAEGEKIQKVLCETDNTCEIMKVNEAVHKTIISITHLEQVLYEKLQTAQELCSQEVTKKDCVDNDMFM